MAARQFLAAHRAARVFCRGLRAAAQEWQSYWQPLLERVRSLPGIEGAALTTGYPPEGANAMAHMRIPGHTPSNPRLSPIINGDIVGDGYFRLLGLRLIAGRYFTAADGAAAPPVTIINESFARTYFPQQSPIGQSLVLNPGPKYECSTTIVGVVADARARLDKPVEPHHYRPLAQVPLRGFNLLVRTAGAPAASFDALRDTVNSFKPHQPVPNPVTLDELWARYTIKPRFYLSVLGSLAVLAVLLAATGIYGTLFLAVGQRRHEIGVRRALGAQDGAVLRLVLRQGMYLALTGLLIGLLGALVLTRFIRGWLFEVSATDPLTFAAGALLFLLVVLVACYLPARRATRIDPLVALRRE